MMDSLQAMYRDDDEEDDSSHNNHTSQSHQTLIQPPNNNNDVEPKSEPFPSDDNESQNPNKSPKLGFQMENEADDEDEEEELELENEEQEQEEDEEEDEEDPPPKKQKHLSSLTTAETVLIKEESPALPGDDAIDKNDSNANNNDDGSSNVAVVTPAGNLKKSSKKKGNNVWVTKSTRKGKKKSKSGNNSNNPVEDSVMITPVSRFPDKTDDTPEMKICLSKVYKAEKVELSEDRMSAGSTKGYRMVRATRGVVEGAWYFEIKVVNLGETGHTRLGWSSEKGDLQAPVGYDGNSFGYRDIDGSKIHKALREKYGEEGYKEGDVIGFYIDLPDGALYAPKAPHLVWHKGQRYVCGPDVKDDPPKVVPGSQISFFKNGVCQGVAFQDLYGGRYYPAASMYTLPNEPNCTVQFNFGPDFEFFLEDFDGRPVPRPMVEAPYHGFDNKVENGEPMEK